jgi:hypothetical protein
MGVRKGSNLTGSGLSIPAQLIESIEGDNELGVTKNLVKEPLVGILANPHDGSVQEFSKIPCILVQWHY